MKKAFLNILLVVLLLANAYTINVSALEALEKGNPSMKYPEYAMPNTIILPDNTTRRIDLFINGTAITGYDLILMNDRTLVPVQLISWGVCVSAVCDENRQTVIIQKDEIKITLTIDEDKALVNDIEVTLDVATILYNGSIYVPLRFIAETLDYTVSYATGGSSDEWTYFHDTQWKINPSTTVGRIIGRTEILIDEKYDSSTAPTKEEALKHAQEICMEGLENFKRYLSERYISWEPADFYATFGRSFEHIERDINLMLYIGEVSRYYQFTIGGYDILYDKYNCRMFFVIYSSWAEIKEVDVYDSNLYMPLYIVG